MVGLFGMAALLVFVVADALGYAVKTQIRRTVVTYRRMGRKRFVMAFALWMLWGAVCLYLGVQTGWPDAYGAHSVGRGAWLVWLWQSPALLKTGTFASDALFVWIWVIFPAVLAFSLWHVPRKISKAARSRRMH